MSNYKAPTPELVEAALLKIPTMQLRQVFFEGLKNPLWVRPLLDARAFSSPPEPRPTDDGYIYDPYWPELSYLTRISSEVPADVVDVFLALEKSSNPWVRRAVFEIGSRIPANEAVRLMPLLRKWQASGFGWRTDSLDLVAFAVTLLEGGHRKEGRWLANTLFEPRRADGDDGHHKPVVGLDDYWYADALPKIVPALGADALKALIGWLRSYVAINGHASGAHDFSAMDRPSIAEPRSGYDRPEDALIDAVRDQGIVSASLAPDETIELFLRPRVQLLRKIAIYVVRECMRREVESGGDAHRLVAAARRLLSEPGSDDEYLRVEYAHLARIATQIDYSVSSVIPPFLEQAYRADLAWMRERLVPEGTDPKSAEAEIQEKADRYRHGWLAAIGHDALPPELRQELAQLDATQGGIEKPLEPLGQVTSWTGPNPHTSQEDMAMMAPMELVACLADWHDTDGRWGPNPSHEGQGRALTALLATYPMALHGVPALGAKLRPTYLRAILQGWDAALKADLELDWQQVAELIQFVLRHDLGSTLPAEGDDFDDDKNFRGAKDAAVDLLKQLVKPRETPSISDTYAERFARLLIRDADDESAWSEYDAYIPSDGGWDPLTMSLNWQWPSRIRALVVAATNADDASWKHDALAALDRELARVDRHGAGRAVIGEQLGRLYVNARPWLDTRLQLLVGTQSEISTEQQVVVTTAMATHRYHPDLYDLLSDAMQAALRVGESLRAGWSGESEPLPRIGEWIIDAVVFGHRTTQDPLFQAFFSEMTPKTRAEALGKVAWSFSRATQVDDEKRDRFGLLWDERIAYAQAHPDESQELEGIFWLAKGQAFSFEWWLPRLRGALELEPSIATERYMISKELAEASKGDPATAFAVLKLLLQQRGTGSRVYYDMSRHAVPVVIANALMSGDAALAADATDFMNELGARGLRTLEDEVRAVIEGTVTAGD
jgi:hypothetical protein